MNDILTADAIKDWSGEALTGLADPLVPLPPDGKVNVRPIRPRQWYPETVNGQPARERVEMQHFEMVFTIRPDERPETIRRLPWRLRDAANDDHTLGGRVRDAFIPLNQAEPEDHERVLPQLANNGWVIRVPLVLTEPGSATNQR